MHTKSAVSRIVSALYDLGGCLYGAFRWIVYGWRPVHRHGANPSKLTPEQLRARRAVVLLHGDPDNQSCFIPLLKFLKNHDIGPCFSTNLDYKHEKDDFRKLDAKLEKVRDLFGPSDEPVRMIFVCYSMGGITAARRFWNHEELVDGIEPELLITLGSRLGSTKPTHNWTIRFFHHLIPRIHEFQEAYENHTDKVDIRTISALHDWRVPPEASQIAEDPIHNFVVKHGGHAWLPYSREAHEKIVTWIDEHWATAPVKELPKAELVGT